MAVAPVQWAMAKEHTVSKAVTYKMTMEAAHLKVDDTESQGLSPRKWMDLQLPRCASTIWTGL